MPAAPAYKAAPVARGAPADHYKVVPNRTACLAVFVSSAIARRGYAEFSTGSHRAAQHALRPGQTVLQRDEHLDRERHQDDHPVTRAKAISARVLTEPNVTRALPFQAQG